MPIFPRCCSVLIVTCVVQTYIICLGPRKAIFIFRGINTALACKHFNFSSIGLCVSKGCWELTRMLLYGVWKIGKKAEFLFFVNQTIHFSIFSSRLLAEGFSESSVMLREMALKSKVIPEATQQVAKVGASSSCFCDTLSQVWWFREHKFTLT